MKPLLLPVLPEAILLGAACVVLLVDLVLPAAPPRELLAGTAGAARHQLAIAVTGELEPVRALGARRRRHAVRRAEARQRGRHLGDALLLARLASRRGLFRGEILVLTLIRCWE
jgi:hypothetical protein